MVACLRSHPPLFDRLKLDFTTRLFRYLDKMTERIYLMTCQAEHIEEGLRRIFVKLFQCFHIHSKVWQPLINRELRNSPLLDRWNLSIEIPSEYTKDYSLQ